MSTPTAADLEAARLLLDRLGITPDDLLIAPADRPPVPTFAEYIPQVSGAVSVGTRRVYRSYWNKILAKWADRRLDEPTPTEIRQMANDLKAGRVQRRNGRGGDSTIEHFIAALRCVYRHAEDDNLITPDQNPARKVDKPRRKPSTRHALAHDRLAALNNAAADSGDDPELDALIVRLHTETACRRGGALALRPQDLNEEDCLIYLREKGETARWQPVSPTLMAHLVAHADERRAPSGHSLLRYRDGTPVGRRRYDHLWNRIGQLLPWAGKLGVTTHWIRHTTLTWVERVFGYAIAHAYAGHTDTTSRTGDGPDTTITYVRGTVAEVATALAVLTGEPHPLGLAAAPYPDPASTADQPLTPPQNR